MSVSKKDESESDEEIHPEVEKFNEHYDDRVNDLFNVLNYLINDCGLKTKQAIKYDASIEYFRGVKFYLLVLENSEEVLKRLPNFTKDGMIKSMSSIKDVTKLGQFMMFTGILSRSRTHSNLVHIKPDTAEYKHPKYHMHVEPLFGPAGTSGSIDCYIIERKQDSKFETFWTIFVVSLLFAFLFFSYWPYWLQSATWTGFVYCIVGYFAIGGSRIVFWLFFYHFGVNLWLFPKYRDSWNPTKFLWPVVFAEKR